MSGGGTEGYGPTISRASTRVDSTTANEWTPALQHIYHHAPHHAERGRVLETAEMVMTHANARRDFKKPHHSSPSATLQRGAEMSTDRSQAYAKEAQRHARKKDKKRN